MVGLILKILLALYLVQGLLKMGVPLLIKKERRMKMVASLYAGKGSRANPTRLTDAILSLFCLIFLGLLFASGMEFVSFTTGFLVGMTLLQLYFHAFNTPLEKQPAPPVTPIQLMSYAIKEMPQRAWIASLFISGISIWLLVLLLIHR